MNTPQYFEPDSPAPLKAPWLKVTVDEKVYSPHLVRIRKRWFPVEMIEKLDVKRHGHAHPIYHLIYFLEGSNTILVDNETVDVRSGQMILIHPDVYHNVVPREPRDCAFLTLMFTYQCGEEVLTLPFGSLLKHLTGFSVEPKTVVNDREKSLRPYFTCLEKEVLGQRKKNLAQVGYCLAGLLNEIPMCSLRRSRTQAIPEDILVVQQYLIENLDKSITIKDLTEISHLSRSHLIGKFKEYCGLSPIDFLIQERIEKAKTYLLHSTKRIKEISWMCGFQSEYYFSKTFKKRTGMTPGSFRKGTPDSEYGNEYF